MRTFKHVGYWLVVVVLGKVMMEAVKEFCKNAGGYRMQQLQDSVRALQGTVKVGSELTPQAVHALMSKLAGLWRMYR